MPESLTVLLLTAASIGVLHALLGPDHYLPFVFMAQAGGWSRRKLLAITVACGLGHVLSSVVLGAAGIGAGLALTRLAAIESFRGALAAWGLLAFGLVYGVWGLRRAARRRPHAHIHRHRDGTVHRHEHVHEAEHLHAHTAEAHNPGLRVVSLTPWVLFTLFVFGPCEPLIPLLLVPAAAHSAAGVVLVATVFGAATLATMAAAVLLCRAGADRLAHRLGSLERYTHALAGGTLALCGAAVLSFGL